MDKASLMRAFKAMCDGATMPMSFNCKQLVPPLLGLKPIEIREGYIRSQQLDKEMCFEGRVVQANICATAKVEERMVLCLVESEPEDGGCAFIQIFNAIKSTSKPEEALTMYPKDVKIAIKEPVFYCSIMQVGTPASVELIGLPKKLRRKSVEELKKEGDKLLSNGENLLAELHYTELINLFSARDKSTYGEMEKDVFLNRAEARLKLGRYEEAIADTETASSIGSLQSAHQLKSLHTKGRSLIALQEHQLALSCLESVEPTPPPKILEDITKCEAFLRQNKQGEYDISRHLLEEDNPQHVEYADFFGPLEVKMTPDGRGRGVYLTKDVRIGELLLVCNPTSAVLSSDEPHKDLYVELVKSCLDSEKKLRHVNALFDHKRVPDINVFKTNNGKVFSKRESRVLNTEHVERVGANAGFSSYDEHVHGVWAFAGLINHSCLPNASRMCIGDVLFVRAAKAIKAGEEVLVSYLGATLSPFHGYRELALQFKGFVCQCQRCSFEREKKDILKDLPHNDVPENVLEVVLDIEKRIKPFSEEERNWIRAGYADIYLAACISKDENVPSLKELFDIFHATAPGNMHTLSRMAIMLDYGEYPDEAVDILNEEVVSMYGKQSQEVIDAVVRKSRVPNKP